jgi:hypothetical protein
MWQAAALFDPPPFIGMQLAGQRDECRFASPPRVRRPTAAHFDLLVNMMVFRQIRRVRNRRFRVDKTPSAFVRELVLAREYGRLAGVDVTPVTPAEGEDQLLSEHERWVADWRIRLHPRLQKREK